MTHRTLNELANEFIQQDFAGDYDGEDLINCLIILQQVAHSLTWHRDNANGVPMTERMEKAEQFGRDLRDSIIRFSGIDPKDLVESETETLSVEISEG